MFFSNSRTFNNAQHSTKGKFWTRIFIYVGNDFSIFSEFCRFFDILYWCNDFSFSLNGYFNFVIDCFEFSTNPQKNLGLVWKLFFQKIWVEEMQIFSRDFGENFETFRNWFFSSNGKMCSFFHTKQHFFFILDENSSEIFIHFALRFLKSFFFHGENNKIS